MGTKRKGLIRNVILVIALFIFILSSINIYKSIKEYSSNNKLYEDMAELNPFAYNDLSSAYNKLKELNNDYIGWISIPGTNINYPIVKGTDNSFYLNHNFLKEESKVGAIFVDCNTNEFEDRNTIIYGHYMKDGSMFADLHKISSESNDTYKVYIATEIKILEYEIFSLFKDSADINNYQTFWSTTEKYLSFLSMLKEKSIYDYSKDIMQIDTMLTLSTCDFNYNNGRLLVYLKEV